MKIDPTLNFGLIVTVLLMIATIIRMFVRLEAHVERQDEYRKQHETRLEKMEQIQRDLTNIVTVLSTKAEFSEWGGVARRKERKEGDAV